MSGQLGTQLHVRAGARAHEIHRGLVECPGGKMNPAGSCFFRRHDSGAVFSLVVYMILPAWNTAMTRPAGLKAFFHACLWWKAGQTWPGADSP